LFYILLLNLSMRFFVVEEVFQHHICKGICLYLLNDIGIRTVPAKPKLPWNASTPNYRRWLIVWGRLFINSHVPCAPGGTHYMRVNWIIATIYKLVGDNLVLFHWDIVPNLNLDEMIKLDELISPEGVKNCTNGVSYNDS